MISKSLMEMIKGRWREFVREPSAFFFVISMPVLWMVVLGLAFSKEGHEVYSVGVLQNNMDSQIVEVLQENETIKVTVGDEKVLKPQLTLGKLNIMLGFDQNGIQYYLDPANPMAKRAKSIVNDIIQTSKGRTDPVFNSEMKMTSVGNRYIDFLIPGLLALSIMTTSLFGTGMTIVLHRRDNLLKRYLTTPMKAYEYLVSHIIGRYFMLFVEFSVIYVSALLMFGFQIRGSFLAYLVFAILGTTSFAALSVWFGARTNNTAAYNGRVNLLVLPMMMLSGIWFSRSGFPDWLSSIIDYVPLAALVDGLRKIALEGAGLTDVGFQIAVLSGYTLLGIVAAKMRFKWYD